VIHILTLMSDTIEKKLHDKLLFSCDRMAQYGRLTPKICRCDLDDNGEGGEVDVRCFYMTITIRLQFIYTQFKVIHEGLLKDTKALLNFYKLSKEENELVLLALVAWILAITNGF